VDQSHDECAIPQDDVRASQELLRSNEIDRCLQKLSESHGECNHDGLVQIQRQVDDHASGSQSTAVINRLSCIEQRHMESHGSCFQSIAADVICQDSFRT
jgi:hypothetical protein